MRLSRAQRRQCLGADLAMSAADELLVVDAAVATVTGRVDSRTLYARIERLCRSARRHAGVALDASGVMVLTRKERKAYLASLRELQTSVLGGYGPDVDPRSFVAAVLVWIEDVRATLPPRPPERRAVWFELAEALQALQDRFPRDEIEVDHGAVVGENFKQQVRVW